MKKKESKMKKINDREDRKKDTRIIKFKGD
jgi:hypothetical protein